MPRVASQPTSMKEKASLNIDFTDAFNSVSRDVMLIVIRDELTELFPFIDNCHTPVIHFYVSASISALVRKSTTGQSAGSVAVLHRRQGPRERINIPFNSW